MPNIISFLVNSGKHPSLEDIIDISNPNSKKNNTWKINSKKRIFFGFIPNHPDSSINRLTQTTEKLCKEKRAKETIGCDATSSSDGVPIETKPVCTTKTRTIAMILNNSKLESLLMPFICLYLTLISITRCPIEWLLPTIRNFSLPILITCHLLVSISWVSKLAETPSNSFLIKVLSSALEALNI